MAHRAAESLAYAVRGRALARYGGDLCLALVGIAAIPALVAAIARDWRFAATAGSVAALLALLGLGFRRVPGPRRLQSNEALVIVAVAYLLTAALMSWPMTDGLLPPVDAFFHSMSAVTTTGLTTVGSVEDRSVAFLFTQAWMQWYGGLVVVVLAVLLMGPGESARRLSGTEQEWDLAAGTRARAKWALAVYAALTGIGFVLLLLLGASSFDALLSTLSGVSTGGFSAHDDSLAGLGPAGLQGGVILLSLAGAVPFARYKAAGARGVTLRERWRGFLDREVVALLLLCALAAVLLSASLALAGGASWDRAVLNGSMLAVSAQSTSGFTPTDVAALDEGSKLVTIVCMFVGGGQGSTAGGIKVLRLLLMLRLLQVLVLRPALPPHAVVPSGPGGPHENDGSMRQAIAVVGVYGGVVLLSWAAFVASGHDALDSLFEVVSAAGTVGLSTGVAGPGLEPWLKLVLASDMWMGRLEVLAVLVLLHPRTWIGRRSGNS